MAASEEPRWTAAEFERIERDFREHGEGRNSRRAFLDLEKFHLLIMVFFFSMNFPSSKKMSWRFYDNH